MSRSYKKVCLDSYKTEDGNSFKRSKRYRAESRVCIHSEITSHDYGDVLFPSYKSFPKAAHFTYHNMKNEISQRYFWEIRNILNGYQEWDSWRGRERYTDQPREDYQKTFIESFDGIKRGSPFGVKLSRYQNDFSFEWLNIHEAKEAVKEWEGDPLDILYYLTSLGIIEKAVCIKLKRMVKK